MMTVGIAHIAIRVALLIHIEYCVCRRKLAMNEQQTIEDLKRKLDAALHDLLSLSASITESCLYCKHYQGDDQENACPDTPCHGCDFRNHWEWRGVTDCG